MAPRAVDADQSVGWIAGVAQVVEERPGHAVAVVYELTISRPPGSRRRWTARSASSWAAPSGRCRKELIAQKASRKREPSSRASERKKRSFEAFASSLLLVATEEQKL